MFILYFTSGCHLCDLAEQQIAQFNGTHPNAISYRKVEISEDDSLVKEYGSRIPVIQHPAIQATLDWPFNQPDLENLLKQIKLKVE
ncbi:glutaredoxin family protein [Reinekea marinisedimentorum]|uniref:Glutaredoxin-like protein DUF836 n=1 Tax=Reinekea marinisedimentorum TaxID=230495 RepID=A0A4R3IAJ1_9GAMM|nr:glutaredoxin family protein [Reinekea marinisedimentorum]TCS42440.1 glutaredoxin-like protein DUF836 [Reinekea marinisedimentorum]